jgi:altronate dehydratase small subunit
MAIEAFVIDAKDNVATLFIHDGRKGSNITVQVDDRPIQIELLDNVPFAHKFAIRHIAKGDQVTKYGYSIGTATEDIQAGQHVHIHNTESNRGRGDLAAAHDAPAGASQ